MGYVFIAGTIIFTVFGQLIIRQQLGRVDAPTDAGLARYLVEFTLSRPLVLAGLASAMVASLFWMATLTRFELSFAYPFMALNFVIVSMLAVVAFNEDFNVYKLVGLLIVVIGLLVLAQGS